MNQPGACDGGDVRNGSLLSRKLSPNGGSKILREKGNFAIQGHVCFEPRVQRRLGRSGEAS